MKIERKHINIGIGVLIAGTIGFFIFHRIRAKSIKDELMKILSEGKGKTGTSTDLSTGYNKINGKDVRWTSAVWFGKSTKANTRGTKESAMMKALAIKNAIGVFSTDDAKMLTAIRNIKYQNEASYVAYYLNSKYGGYTLQRAIAKMKLPNQKIATDYLNNLPLE